MGFLLQHWGLGKKGSSKGEASSRAVAGLLGRSPSSRHSRMKTAGVLRGWWGRACPTPQPGSRPVRGQPETHVLAWLMDDAGPKSN